MLLGYICRGKQYKTTITRVLRTHTLCATVRAVCKSCEQLQLQLVQARDHPA